MTPLELLGLIAAIAVARVAMSFLPVSANAGATSAGVADIPRPPATASLRATIKEYLDAFIVAGLFALLLITFVVRTFYIPSESMVPTLLVHDVLLVNEFEYRFHAPHDGDIVVFPPPIPTTDDFIKRLMASPGDTLRIHNGTVYRNGIALAEPYIAQRPNYELDIRNYTIYVDGVPMDPSQGNIPPRSAWTSPDTVPPNCYFMMGDNRNDSEDSHLWGFAQLHGTFATGPEAGKKAGLTGHALFTFWPLNRIGLLL